MIFKDDSEWKFKQHTRIGTEQTREGHTVDKILNSQQWIQEGHGGGGKSVTSTLLIQKVDCSCPDLRKMQCSS